MLNLVVSLTLLGAPEDVDQNRTDFFEKKIRPVLVEKCYKCHSSEAEKSNKLKADLRLDSRAGLLRGGESGPALVPGKANASLLIRALRHVGDLKMPPKGKLSAQAIADFEKWISMGAPDPRTGPAVATPAAKVDIDIEKARRFWSFQPLRETAVPRVKNDSWARTDIDRYVLARQESAGVTPNVIADRRTLIRRLYYGVLGLPPTREDVEGFENDASPDAYDKLVERVLESPHHGERWARHWLDLARFAESNGYAFDKDRPSAFHYRDFVIRALNEDMPYDEFIRLQLAGDLLRPNDYMAVAATGFLVAGPFTTQQTMKERERSRYEQLDDIIATLGTAALGLTVGCARCHDHKFDPVPMHDYYRLISTFAEVGFQDVGLDLSPEAFKKAKAAHDATHQPLVTARAKYEREQLLGKLTQWIANRPEDPEPPAIGDWHWIGPFTAANFDKAFEQAFAPEKGIDLKKSAGKLKWKKEEGGWKDGVVHNPFTAPNAAHYLYRTIDVKAPVSIEVSLGRDDAIKVWLNKKELLSKKVQGGAAANQDKVTLALRAGRNEFLMKIVNGGGPSGFYFKAAEVGPPKNIRGILALSADKQNAKQKQELLNWFRKLDPGWQKLNEAVVASEKKAPKQKLTNVYAARNGGTTYNFGADTRKVYFLVRGNSNNKKGLATPSFLQVLMGSSDEAAGSAEKAARWTTDISVKPPQPNPPRVAMAAWLTDPEHGAGHLLARVIVNRLWQHHIGRGIVSTPSDFGQQGERPTHPELLDYLARQLIKSGWRLKAIHRLILTSSVYMQGGGTTNPENGRADPENRLFWRRPARRLEAEIIRDALLATSGQLDRKMYGKGSLTESDKRRSVYLTIKRSKLIPTLQLFDAPDAMQSIGDRSTTTVAPQALAMMNSPFVRGLATAFAARIRPQPDTDPKDIVETAYWIALSRPPTDDERIRMLELIDQQTASYGGDDRAKTTAVVDFCQLLMCLNEFVYVD